MRQETALSLYGMYLAAAGKAKRRQKMPCTRILKINHYFSQVKGNHYHKARGWTNALLRKKTPQRTEVLHVENSSKAVLTAYKATVSVSVFTSYTTIKQSLPSYEQALETEDISLVGVMMVDEYEPSLQEEVP